MLDVGADVLEAVRLSKRRFVIVEAGKHLGVAHPVGPLGSGPGMVYEVTEAMGSSVDRRVFVNTSFVNPVVDVVDVPRVDEASFEPVASVYLWAAWLVTAAMAVAVIGVLIVVGLFDFASVPLVAAIGAAVLGGALVVGLLQRAEVKRMGYLVREHDISFRRGLVSVRVETIPFSRVQSVTLERDLSDRGFGLSELTLQTAGGQLSIVGLSNDQAASLKALIVDRANLAAEAEQLDQAE